MSLSSRLNSAASTNATSVTTASSTVYRIVASNSNAAVRYLKLYDLAVAPNVGTDIPILSIPLPAVGMADVDFGVEDGIRFQNGLAFALTTGAADNNSSAVAAGEIKVIIQYD
jgi:hypothetical protein